MYIYQSFSNRVTIFFLHDFPRILIGCLEGKIYGLYDHTYICQSLEICTFLHIEISIPNEFVRFKCARIVKSFHHITILMFFISVKKRDYFIKLILTNITAACHHECIFFIVNILFQKSKKVLRSSQKIVFWLIYFFETFWNNFMKISIHRLLESCKFVQHFFKAMKNRIIILFWEKNFIGQNISWQCKILFQRVNIPETSINWTISHWNTILDII